VPRTLTAPPTDKGMWRKLLMPTIAKASIVCAC
jgi:hypothetical protein